MYEKTTKIKKKLLSKIGKVSSSSSGMYSISVNSCKDTPTGDPK